MKRALVLSSLFAAGIAACSSAPTEPSETTASADTTTFFGNGRQDILWYGSWAFSAWDYDRASGRTSYGSIDSHGTDLALAGDIYGENRTSLIVRRPVVSGKGIRSRIRPGE